MLDLRRWHLRSISRLSIVHRLPRRLHLFGHRHPNQMSHRDLFTRRRRDLHQLRRRDLRLFRRFDVVHNVPRGVFLYHHGDADEMPHRNVLAWGFVDMRQVPCGNFHLVDWRFLVRRLPGWLYMHKQRRPD